MSDFTTVYFTWIKRGFNIPSTLVEFSLFGNEISIKFYGVIIAFGFILAALFGGELVAQLCILAAEAVALLLERFDLLLALERGFFDITNDVIAVEAAEDGALEGIFHDFPTFSFVNVMVTQTRRDDKEKSATS